MLDVKRIREDFPILHRTVHEKPLVYLDNAATSQKPRQVIEALVRYYSRSNANIHRGLHTLSEEATAAYEAVREQTAQFLHAPSSRSIVFTRNATESLNLVAQAWGRANLHAGDQILLTEMEHHSNVVPWQLIAQETGAELRFLKITEDGRLDLAGLATLLTKRTKVVAVSLMSNVLGTINPVAEIAEAAHRHGAIVVVDGAQGVPHLAVDVRQLGCDFLACSSHKMLGPTGVGVLYGREELLEAMPPFLGGGEMIADVQLTTSTWNDLPWKFEAGTPNIADVIAFGEALAYLTRLGMVPPPVAGSSGPARCAAPPSAAATRGGMDAVRAHEMEWTAYALKRLSAIEGITLYGPRDVALRGSAVAFNLNGLHPHDVGTALDMEGIAVRAGHHCAKPLMRRLGVVATARASGYLYNTLEEVDRLVEALHAVKAFFGRSTRVAV